MSTKYNYNLKYDINEAGDIQTAIYYTIINYLHQQLGLSIEYCKERVNLEIDRAIPKALFDYLKRQGWKLKDKKILDIGCGQGSAIIEALYQGAIATGVEPGKEFFNLAKMRLAYHGFEENIILNVEGEKLPFEDNYFEYIISLQVLEHVRSPRKILEEIYRVLKPGGQCFISCENYFSFYEPHYKIPWLPLLPKSIGTIYLKFLKRNPTFLNEYIYYTTYPQIWDLVKKIGFVNKTYSTAIKNLLDGKHNNMRLTFIANLLNLLPYKISYNIMLMRYHLKNLFAKGIRIIIEKPVK